MSILPIGYIKLEYVWSNAVVQLDFPTTQDTEIECTFYKVNSTSQYLYYSSSGSNRKDNTTAYLSASGGNWRFGDDTVSILMTKYYNQKIVSKQNKEGVRFNGSSKGAYSDIKDFVSSTDLKLFSSSNGNVRICDLIIRSYSTKEIQHHLIPCKDSSNVVGFYDTITRTFYSGGEAGPEI